VAVFKRSVKRPKPRLRARVFWVVLSRLWPSRRSVLANHVPDVAACDFLTVPTVIFRVRYVFIVLRHDRRHVVHR
jgi:hypothetical protein